MTSEKRRKKSVNFKAVLFNFIEPIVILYKSGRSFFIASALPSEKGFVEEYLLVSVTPKIMKRYFREENDLRYLFVSAPNRSFWNMPASEFGKDSAKITEYTGEITEDMLPEPQFFASSHTHSFSEMQKRYSSLETLYIDGNWEMEDFGTFSRRYRDIYAFEESINKIVSDKTPEKQAKSIGEAFKGNSLRGGGSYVNLFNELLNNLPKDERYDLKSVEYASPGKIQLQGKGEVFDTIENRIKNLIGKQVLLHEKYWSLRKLMSEKKLLDISAPTSSISRSTREKIEADSKSLLGELGIDIFDKIHDLNGGRSVNTAKVAMAVYRRLKQASVYFSEGRVAYERE